MKIQVNPETSSAGFGYAAAGKVVLRVTKCEQKQKTGSPYPYISWEYEFTDPNVQAVDGVSKVGHVFDNTTLHPEFQFALKRLIEAIGATWAEFDTEEMIGREFEADITVAADNKGGLRNEIGRYIPKA